jgi:hypothetical protein
VEEKENNKHVGKGELSRDSQDDDGRGEGEECA